MDKFKNLGSDETIEVFGHSDTCYTSHQSWWWQHHAEGLPEVPVHFTKWMEYWRRRTTPKTFEFHSEFKLVHPNLVCEIQRRCLLCHHSALLEKNPTVPK
ncbi:hypothetical protein ILYODFUR_038703 [Ilyodon furcidens]|uniref:Uncharacterized protein n=1 Tax=Ilyodon furcidens TaxID=33524 RepID=A0ABV0UZN8_9TELE